MHTNVMWQNYLSLNQFICIQSNLLKKHITHLLLQNDSPECGLIYDETTILFRSRPKMSTDRFKKKDRTISMQ